MEYKASNCPYQKYFPSPERNFNTLQDLSCLFLKKDLTECLKILCALNSRKQVIKFKHNSNIFKESTIRNTQTMEILSNIPILTSKIISTCNYCKMLDQKQSTENIIFQISMIHFNESYKIRKCKRNKIIAYLIRQNILDLFKLFIILMQKFVNKEIIYIRSQLQFEQEVFSLVICKNPIKTFRISNNVAFLYLGFTPINCAASVILCSTLKENRFIKDFSLIKCNIGPEEIKILSVAFKKNSTIKKLSLEGNQIRDKGAEFISDVIKCNVSITWITLCKNEIGKSGIKFISNCLRFNDSIISLNLSDNNIGNLGTIFLSKALTANRALTLLDISGNKIESIGTKFLSCGMENWSIAKLDLSLNQIEDSGSKHLSKALRLNHSLTFLKLYQNKIEEIGSEFLSRMLKVNNSITEFNMSDNTLIAQSFFTSIEKNTSLLSLDLSNTGLNSDAANFISEYLRENQTLRSLDLKNNSGLHKEGVKVISECILNNNTLLHISFEQMDRGYERLLPEAMRKIKSNKLESKLRKNMDENY
jgi:Ran GTPase-activating protein (RanGAP) involved in mRNA processing and transport